jgi:hypothetical protein
MGVLLRQKPLAVASVCRSWLVGERQLGGLYLEIPFSAPNRASTAPRRLHPLEVQPPPPFRWSPLRIMLPRKSQA